MANAKMSEMANNFARNAIANMKWTNTTPPASLLNLSEPIILDLLNFCELAKRWEILKERFESLCKDFLSFFQKF